MQEAAAHLWAKTSERDSALWHPLILHLIDVATCADAILEREPAATRRQMSAILGHPWEESRPWLLTVRRWIPPGKGEINCPS